MQNFTMDISGESVLCDGEGYFLDMEACSENYGYVSAKHKELELHDEHCRCA